MKNYLGRVSVGMTLALLAGTALSQEVEDVKQISGVLDDGQQWQISMPSDWNGIVINDLDAVAWLDGSWGSSGPSEYFLSNGYAYTGTKRHPDRNSNWDPNAESNNMVEVLDIFVEEFGDPQTVIQFGCSGGGSF